MESKKSARRQFLKNSAALAGLALGAPRLAEAQSVNGVVTDLASLKAVHAYGQRSKFEKTLRIGNNGDDLPPRGIPKDLGMRSPIQDVVGIITPSSLHYMINHGYEPPVIDPQQHRLMIHGMVDRPMMYTVAELKRLPSVTRAHFVECRADSVPQRKYRVQADATAQVTHGLSSCSMWTGVPLSLLLKNSGIKTGASWIIAEGADELTHSKSIPLEKALDDCLVVYGQNGEAVRPEQGYPLRLLAPGYQGINNVKWLHRIKVVEQPYMSKMETDDYAEIRPNGKQYWFVSQMGPNSVVISPSGGQQMPGRGFHHIKGLAWSGGGAIKRVEVSTDGGKSWKDAEIQQPVYRKAYTAFGLDWTWNGEETYIKSRSTDETGDVQPSVAEYEKIWSLPPGYASSGKGSFLGNFCVIQTWKVNRERECGKCALVLELR